MFPVFPVFLEGKIGKIVEEFERSRCGIEMSWVWFDVNKVSDGGDVWVEEKGKFLIDFSDFFCYNLKDRILDFFLLNVLLNL